MGSALPSFGMIVRAETAEQIEEVRTLFGEYAASLEFPLDFQDFDDEMSRFPGEYTAPGGSILLATNEERTVGCVALRLLEPGVCEMKRLYVRPEGRGLGMGRELGHAVLEEGRRLGYDRMRLYTVPSMQAAIALYESLGFTRIAPYRENPIEGAAFMELELG